MASIDRAIALAEEIKKKKKNPNYQVNQNVITSLDLANSIKTGDKDNLKNYLDSNRGMFDAPIRSTIKDERKWFEKGAFEDGYDFGDITKTVIGSAADLYKNATKGILNIGETTIDTGAYIAGGVGKIFGNDKFANKVEGFIEKDLINEDEIANRITNTGTPIGWVNNLLNGEFSSLNPFGDETTQSVATDETSIFGDKSDSLAQSAGQLGATIGLQAVGVPWWLTTGVTSFGGEVENALKQDATYGEAGFSGLVNAGAEILTEKLSGGISFGGRTLDAGLKSKLTKGITNKTLNTLAQFGIDVVGEGTEELLTEVISNVGKKLSYEDEKTWGEILASEEAMDSYLEAFIGGSILGGGFNVGRVSSSIQSGRNYDTGLTTNEQSIVDKEVQSRVSELEQEGTKLTNKQKIEIEKQVRNDLEKGYISTDTIESTLGGETYNTLKSTRDTKTELENKIAELENKSYAELTVKEMEQLQAYREQLKSVDTNTLENNLRSEMGQKIKSDTYLQRSYQEKANRSVQFEADLSKYDAKQQAVVQKAIDSGILNNTNRTHDFVDMVAKISADKGIDFDFTNNTKLKESGFAVEGKTVNGYIKDGSIAVNIDSSKALNRVVGHEITHVLEGTELYTELQNAVKQYATTKGEYDTRFNELTKLYKDVKDANVENELTADLVGDYLFTDTDFINNLSVEKPSLFKKVYNEIKHLYDMATAGSKEARELLKVKKAFEKAYQENIKGTNETTEVRDSLSEVTTETINNVDSLGRELTSEQTDFFKDSKVVDEDGNLLVMYHGTRADFNTFDMNKAGQNYEGDWSAFGRGFYFTPNQEAANDFSSAAIEGNSKNVKEVYLNITKPFYTETNYSETLSNLKEKYNIDDTTLNKGYRLIEFLNQNGYDSTTVLQELGYDGVIDSYNGKIEEAVAFKPNQIKNTNNTKPTLSEDIRYSLSSETDNQGRTLTNAQVEFFKDVSPEVRDANENLKTLYHGSEVTDITIFKKDKFGDVGINFLVDDADIADTYRSKKGRRYEVYANIKKPLIIEGEGKNWNDIVVGDNPTAENMYNSLTEQEKSYLTDLAKNMDNMYLGENLGREKAIAGFYQRINAYDESLYDRLTPESSTYNKLFDAAKYNWHETYLKDLLGKRKNTNQIVREAYESGIYDGVIFKNIVDRGTHYHKAIGRRVANIYVAFYPNQIKNVDNLNPTNDSDIRYSLSEEQQTELERKAISEQLKEKGASVDGNGNVTLYHITTPKNYNKIMSDKQFIPNQSPIGGGMTLGEIGDRSFFTYDKEWVETWRQSEDSIVMEVKVPAEFIRQGAQNEKEIYIEGALKLRDNGLWTTDKKPTSTFYDRLAVKRYLKNNPSMSLSNPNEQIAPSRNDVFGSDIRLEIAPLQEEIKTLTETVTELKEQLATQEEAPHIEEASNTNIAEDIAPTRKAFNEGVRESAKQIEKELGYLPKDPTKESSYEEVAEILTEEPKTQNDRNKRKAAIIAANVLDKGLVFENVSLKHKNRELMGKWDYTLTSEARAQTAIGQGHYDNETGRTISKSLNEIMEEVNNTGLTKQFYEYIYHKHNVDRMQLADKFEGMKNKPVFGEHITAEASQEIVNQYEFSNPEFMDLARDVYEYVNADRKVLVDNGVISQETADLWSKMYPHYVPIRRAGHTGNAVNVPLDTGRTGINAPIKKATGGSSNILPLFDTMASRTIQTYRAAAKNSFGVELKNTIGTTINSQTTTVDEVIDSVDAQENLLQEGKAGQKPTFTVFENGEKITFEITEDMYDALKPLGDSSILSKTHTIPHRISSIHRGLLTQYNPVFAITNGIKDIQDVLINSQHVVKTYSKIPEAYAQIFKKGYWYQEYMANGGQHNSFFDSQENTFNTGRKGVDKILDLPPLKQIAQLNDFIEIVPRLSEYIASREMGRSIEVSMLDAARVTTNFKAGGNLTKYLNRNGITFLNASVQGAMQQVRNVREAKANGIKGWANLATKFAVAGLPAFLLNALLWDDDEEYEELSDYVKQNYYVVAKTDDGKFIRIPKGRALAVIQDGFKQMKNLVTGDDEADLKSFLDLVVNNLAPSNPTESNIAAPILDVLENETWYGEDLVPTRLQDLPAAEQYDESTDSFSKWLGGVLDISPVKINYLLDQYTGGIGDVILPTLTPEAESGDDSFLGNMIAPLKSKFTTDAVMNNQNVSDFYSKSEELTTNAKKSNATDEDVLKNKYINSVKAEMNELYAEKREIQNSDLPSSEKYNQVREIQSKIVDLSKKALNSYEDIDIYSDYATVGDRQYKVGSDGEWEKINDKQLEKQNEVTDKLGISPNEYWRNKEEYDYAYENPSKYAVATTITDYSTFKTYSSELYDIKADKDADGKSISGSRKEKVFDYINNLDLEFEQRVMLAKLEYPSYDEYNYEVIEYLNNREDITYDKMVLILTELGFTVDAEGNIFWD